MSKKINGLQRTVRLQITGKGQATLTIPKDFVEMMGAKKKDAFTCTLVLGSGLLEIERKVQ